jgi:adenylate cyclase
VAARTTLPAGIDDLTTVPRALLLIDIPGSLRLTRQLGDIEAYRLLRSLSPTIRQAPPMDGGRLVRSLGDGFLLEFDSVEGAVAHAVAVQRGVRALDTPECTIKVRCGIHYGEVLEADGDVFGVAVYLATRVCSHAHGGEILLTGEAREALGPTLVPISSLGPTLLPGFEEPVCLFEIPWRDLPGDS